jgi:hypothetical protein
MIPEGRYTAKAVNALLTYTSTGKEQLEIWLNIAGGEQNGQRATYYGYFGSDAQVNMQVKALRACGWKGDDLADLSGLDQECEIVVKHEEYNGKTSAKVKYVNPLAAAPRAAMAADKARSFANAMKARIRAAEAPEPEREKPPIDDSLPF